MNPSEMMKAYQQLCDEKEALEKRTKQLCRWVGYNVRTVYNGHYHVSTCDYCSIPKYRKDKGKSCPAANYEYACSTELIKYFAESK